MRIVADENMPLVTAFFDRDEVIRRPGRSICRDDLLMADALLVRSVTRVDRELLQGTPVRFLGTATIGTDHIDLAAMAELGVQVASAPGCNARAVGEYVVTALACLAAAQGWQFRERTLGVVGLGNTGQQAVALAGALGVRVLGCDPFVRRSGVEQVEFRELLARSDIVSLHVPLARSGPHPTWHLLDAAALAALPEGAVVLNACRGEVVDGAALRAALATRPGLAAVLDVWEGEPRVDPALLARVALGSPHIAGYSQEGKWRGTEMVYQGFCASLGQPVRHSLDEVVTTAPPLPLEAPEGSLAERLAAVLLQACPLRRDDAALRHSLAAADPGAAFDALRKNYPARREFPAHRVRLPETDPLWPLLRALGFRPA